MHRKHVLLPSREPIFACECLLFFRCPRLWIRGFSVCTRASRATLFIISAAVIWYTVLFRQNRTDRPKELVATLLRGFGERPRSHTNRHMIANEVAEAIMDFDLKILFADEADLLDVKGFDFIRYIYNKTGCPIVVVGLRQILHVIRKYEKFEGRIGPHLEFLPPDENEVLNKILPQLIFPRWQFDPSSAADIKMGMELWERCRPSFRRLRTALQFASVLAEIHEKERISLTILRQTFQMLLGLKHAEEEPEEEEEEPQTEYERESARRQDARAKKHEASAWVATHFSCLPR
jgi:hypothetical protein